MGSDYTYQLRIIVHFSRNNKEVKEKLLFSSNLPIDNSIYLLPINIYNGIAIVEHISICFLITHETQPSNPIFFSGVLYLAELCT